MQLLDQHQDHLIQPSMARAEDSFGHAIRLSRPWGWLDRAIVWAQSEMTHDWRWQIVHMSSDQRPGDYVFYFDSDRDYFAFCMKFQ